MESQRLADTREAWQLYPPKHPHQTRMVSSSLHPEFSETGSAAKVYIFSRRTLSKGQRRNYIKALLCLHEKPSTFGANITGLRSRYDDFQYLHIKQAYLIHYNLRHPDFPNLPSIWSQESLSLWKSDFCC